jgi:uncharacterized RDD family membrane protein YckC
VAREITVITPENIPLTFELAGLATRFGAYLIDLLIQLIVTFAVGIIFAIVLGAGNIAGSSRMEGIIGASAILGFFVIWFGYFMLFEAIWNGQTPGKRAFGLRVMRDGGYPTNFFAVATRNLIRIADFIPMNYGIGALAMFFNPQYKRLGDMVAGTVVIKEHAARSLGSIESVWGQRARGSAPSGLLPDGVANPYDVLAPSELDLLRRYALRRWEMTSDDSERLAYRLVVPLVPRLGITFVRGAAPRYADLVSVLVAAADRRADEMEQAAR